MIKELADGVTANTIKPVLCPEIASLSKDAPVFSSDVGGDASGVLVGDALAGSYVLMCHRLDRLTTQGRYVAAQIEVA